MRLLFLLIFLIPGCEKQRSSAVEQLVRFRSGGHILEGTLNLPQNGSSYPLAIFVHGSGMRTRDDFRSFVKPFNDAGIATFRYDKRGVGNSGGTYTDVGTSNSEEMFSVLAADAVAAIDHLKKDSRINPRKIIVIGISQAGWIIPVINTITEVHASVCISGPAVSVGEEIFYSNLAEHGTYSQAYADGMLTTFKGPRGFEPIERIKKMTAPSLWLFGESDVSIPVKRSAAVLDSVRTKARLPLEMKFYPQADHGLFNVETHERIDFVTEIKNWLIPKL